MAIEEKYIGESPLKGTPQKGFSFKLKDGSVTSSKIANGSITVDKLNDSLLDNIIYPYIDKVTEDIQNQISSYDANGAAFSNKFGSNPHIGVSQLTLTQAFLKLWNKIDEITGELSSGIKMTVTPDYFISEDGCDVNVTATSVYATGPFEYIAIYFGETLMKEAEDVNYFEYQGRVEDTTLITCKAQIMGYPYEASKWVTRYDTFFLGGGDTYTDIMDVEHSIKITNPYMRGNYNITVEDGQHIIIVMAKSFSNSFQRADMNGIEILFDVSDVTENGVELKVYTSKNVYDAGTYNIDING